MIIKTGNAANYAWKPSTYYLVHVELYSGNCRHEAIFHSGFLDSKGRPNGYSCCWSASYDAPWDRNIEYMEVVRELCGDLGFVIALTQAEEKGNG